MDTDNASAFAQLAPFLREYVHAEKWPRLRAIQEKGIEEIVNGSGHLLVASGTASGKTEAAFLPLLSVLALIARQPEKKIMPLALCISPLKALINDQYARLEKMLRASDGIPLWKWHGDVSDSCKKKFIENPGGVLIITPESLEALLLLNARALARIFAGLVFVVIDEVHSFMEGERGLQIQCQLSRIAAALPENHSARRIGLSATLWDYGGAADWLAMGTPLPVSVVSDSGETARRKLRLAVDYFEKDDDLYRALFAHSRGKRSVIFAPGRSDTEDCIAALKKIARASGEKESFRIHHGSVAAHLRLDAEENLRTGEGPQTTVATSTLELGIDIGGLDRIIQMGPPSSVSTFVQRLGRSGRKSGAPEMCFCLRGTPGSGLASVAWGLLKTAAVVELYLREKWIEPPPAKPFPASLLVHEILALLRGGEQSAARLRGILRRAPFAGAAISEEDFAALLRHLLKCGYLEKTEEGNIILGLAGEKIANRRSFYTVFPGDEFFRVLFEGREIGTVNFVPEAGAVIAVAGKLWRVAGADGAHREIDVKEAGSDGQPPEEAGLWRGSGAEIHGRVAEKVKEILSGGKDEFAYLSPGARKALGESRAAAWQFNLLAPAAAAPRKSGDTFTRYYLNLYLGSGGMRTAAAFLRMGETAKRLALSKFDGILVNDENDFCLEVASKIGADEFPSLFQTEFAAFCAESPESAAARIGKKQIPLADKYDYLLPPELLAKSYALNLLSLSKGQK